MRAAGFEAARVAQWIEQRTSEPDGSRSWSADGHVRPRGGRSLPALSCVMLVCLFGANIQADTGSGDSPNFRLDTQYYFGSADSRSFVLDTRVNPVLGIGDSSFFTLDTRSGVVPSVAISGRVTVSGGQGLADASVLAMTGGFVAASTSSDANGYYALPLLGAGAYDFRASKFGYLGRLYSSSPISAGQTGTINFALSPLPEAPIVQQGTVTPPDQDTVSYGELKLWQGGLWVSGVTPDSTKTTVIMTHGWQSEPDEWASSMAAWMQSDLLNTVNITAWDWSNAAHTLPLQLRKAFDRVPNVGEALGQRLATVFPSGSRPRLHFIGHSLGTLVNAKAADYLHETVSPPFDWQQTHMTLLDNAVLAYFEGQLVNWRVNNPIEAAGNTLENGVNWMTPNQAAWMDNYISLFGVPSTKAVNVWLTYAPDFLGLAKFNPSTMHGYAYEWYAKTIQSPNTSPLGFRYSFERLGSSPSWPTPNPYPKGWLLEQNTLTDELSLASVLDLGGDSVADYIRRRMKAAGNVIFQESMVVGAGVAIAIGDVVMTVGEEAWDGLQPEAGIKITLTTASVMMSPAQMPGFAALPPVQTNMPALAKLQVEVPTNAATLTFDYTLTGNGSNDSFVLGINGTNLLEMEARHLPQGQPIASGPVDMTQWKGQTVEMIFGVVGGTSTNASVTVQHLRFNSLVPVSLQYAKSGNTMKLSWPITASGYQLESTPELGGAATWAAVTNSLGIVDFQQVFTNSLTGSNQFFRLRQQ